MSRKRSARRHDEPIARDVRPLPSTPSLEYERKEAKALLKQIRAGEADALARIQRAHPAALRDRTPNEVHLADVQHAIAREYGFTSWPRLVEYFEELDRHRQAPRYNSSDDEPEQLEGFAKWVLQRHQGGDPIVARELAHFVPRFYGRTIADILATPITDAEARIVVARERRRGSWDELIEQANASRAWRQKRVWEGAETPAARARTAMRAHDVAALAAILDAHPELLVPSVTDREWRATIPGFALELERQSKNPTARRVTKLLESHGVDIQRELNEKLLGWPHDEAQPQRLQWYLDRGADPEWIPPNGSTVLEHAIVRYRNAACVDLIAARVTPRKALWVAAGLGDVDGVRGFIAGKGRLMAQGRVNRPDVMAMGGLGGLPPRHDADDLEIMWEAFQIAGWNGRWAAMDALLHAGLPVDYAPIAWPLVIEAVGNMLLPLAEYLVGRGADLDRDWPSPANGSARALARSHLENNPESDNARRLVAICAAGAPDEIVATKQWQRQSPPQLEARTIKLMQLAADDAARRGQCEVTTENMLIGLLRLHNGAFAELFMSTDTDMPKLRAMIGTRLLPDTDLVCWELGADSIAVAAVNAAVADAESNLRESVGPLYVLRGILSQSTGPGARLLVEAGTNIAQLWERLKNPW
jgi:hypothetical protein